MSEYYEWLKVGHIISVICWMAGMFYLPRLFVYHAGVVPGSESDKLFQIMEYKLLKIIMNPSMIATFIFGILLAYIYGFAALGGWFHIKVTAVIILAVFHGLLSRWRRDFANNNNKRSAKFYRIINEIPPILMIIAVIMVIIKPFE